MFAALDFADYAIIVLIVLLFAGGVRVATGFSSSPDAARLKRLEGKINIILQHLGLEYADPATAGGLSPEVKALAEDPSKKIAAIKLHRDQTGVGLKEAKDAVEAYIDGRG